MKVSVALSPLADLRAAIRVATFPTLKAVWANPTLLFRPASLSRVFFGAVWVAFAKPTDEGGRGPKLSLLPHATGTVLDLGAGLGHSVGYFDRKAVKVYVALEPNEMMHAGIRERANAAGYHEEDGSLLILRPCGAEDLASIKAQLDGAGVRVDTLVSLLTLCSIPNPQQTLTRLVREILAPGGQLLFYEHVRSPLRDVAWWQGLWTPVWRVAFDGCCLDRPTHVWVAEMTDVNVATGESIGMWSEQKLWGKEGEPDEHLFWHRVGRFVKHSG